MFNKINFRLFLLLLSILMSGCSSQSQQSTVPETSTRTAPVLDSVPTETTVLIPPDVPQLQLPEKDNIIYDIDMTLDLARLSAVVEQKIKFTSGEEKRTEEITMAVLPNTYQDGFLLQSIQLNGSPVKYELEGQKLSITNLSIEPGETVQITLSFELLIPQALQGDPTQVRPQIYGFTERQINLVDWYPFIVPRDSEGNWILNKAGYYGEHLVYPLSSGMVRLRLENFQANPVIAASTTGFREGDAYVYEFQDFRDFVFSIGLDAKVVEGESNGIKAQSVYLPGYEAAGLAVLDTTLKAAVLYSEVFGALDNPVISAVQGDFDDGMEFEGMYYLSRSFYNLYDGEPDQYLVMVAAHETCHQWFFGSVGNDQAFEPWLDESLATYCERLFYERYYPDLLPWWWSARIDFYQPVGKIDGNIYDYQGFDPYTNAVYRRGAKFYEDLRKLIGDEVFFNFLKDYYQSSKGELVDSQSFFEILRRNTSADLTPIMEEYFEGQY